MKMNVSSAAALILLLFSFSSCQKKTEVSVPQGKHDSIYAITGYIELDTSYTSGSDTTFKGYFFYDSKRRLQRAMSFSDMTNTTVVSPYEFITELSFFYDGNDTLPKIIRRTWWGPSDYPNGPSNSDSLYIYYNNGIVIRDSLVKFRFEPKRRVRQFNFIDGINWQFIEKDVHYTGSTADTLSKRIMHAKWVGGNLAEFRDVIGGITVAGYDFDFDNKLNPFKRMRIPYPIDIIHYYRDHGTNFNVNFFLFMPGINNPLSNKAPGSSQIHASWTYDYNQTGFPAVGRINISTSLSKYRMMYYYSKI